MGIIKKIIKYLFKSDYDFLIDDWCQGITNEELEEIKKYLQELSKKTSSK